MQVYLDLKRAASSQIIFALERSEGSDFIGEANRQRQKADQSPNRQHSKADATKLHANAAEAQADAGRFLNSKELARFGYGTGPTCRGVGLAIGYCTSDQDLLMPKSIASSASERVQL